MLKKSPLILTVHHQAPQIYFDYGGTFNDIVVGDTFRGVYKDFDITSLPNWRSLAEMRAHHYIWHADAASHFSHVGFFHYRRALLFPELVEEVLPGLAARSEQQITLQHDEFIEYRRALSHISYFHSKRLNKWFEQYDIIAPIPQQVPGLAEQYCTCHRAADWHRMVEVAAKYGLVVNSTATGLSIGNIFVMRAHLFNLYMKVWREVMSELCQTLEIDADGYQSRTIGFLSERFFTAWLTEVRQDPGIKVREVPLLLSV